MPHEKNLIFVPFAFKEGFESGKNVQKNKAFDLYMKNLCVALLSAKQFNEADDVALVTNVPLQSEYQELLANAGVLVFQEAFDHFHFDKDYPWSLAFYKLCALKKMVENHPYQNYAYMDADVFVQESFQAVWQECNDHILLYDINHGLGVQGYQTFVEQVRTFSPNLPLITHFGGEFFAANLNNAKEFIVACEKVYEKIIAQNYVTTLGDEFILSLAANELKNKIKNAGAYVFRFWTGYFHLVSTSYKFNKITVLHFPDEKAGGLLKIFNRYVRKGKLPTLKKVYKLCHIQKPALRIRLLKILRRDTD